MDRNYNGARDDPHVTNEELFIKEKQGGTLLLSLSTDEHIEESFKEYYNNMQELVKKYDFKCPEKSGTIPKIVSFNDKEYTLIEETHCAICDNSMCQKMFQYQDDRELGYSAFFYPILPVYTHNYQGEYCALCVGL